MENQLRLNDLLNLSEEELARTRIKLNTYDQETHPIEAYKRNPKELLDWNYWNNKMYKVGQISIGLVDMGYGRWLLFTVGTITKVLDSAYCPDGTLSKNGQGIQFEWETMEKYSCLFGRVILEYHNKARQTIRIGERINDFVVKEVLPSIFTGFDFPGYDKVCLTYEQLQTIVNGDYPSYHNALRNQKAVYLQTDLATGKLYVGSATAKEGMLLSRWTSYVKNGHGGNVDLKQLVLEKGFDYIKNNFQYTIIENYNSRVDDAYILEREAYWKTVLATKKYGYNKN